MHPNSRSLNIPLSEVRARYEAGEELKSIAIDAGVSYQTIGRRLVSMGVQLRGKTWSEAKCRKIAEARRLDIPEDELRILHAQRMSCREMAPFFGCNEETIRERLIELDLPRLPGKARPEKNYFWQGGYAVDLNGYILQHSPDHPYANQGGYVRQHRLVMEKILGRYLLPEEIVHHRNEDKSDNYPENLQLFASNADHLAHHRSMGSNWREIPKEERGHRKQEDIRRAYRRVAAILAESGNGVDQ